MSADQDQAKGGQKPKIIVDDDWKQQAAAEKERLAKEEAEQAERPKLPQASFLTLVSSFLTQAMLAMGLIEHPEMKGHGPDLDLAKFNIDMLEVLEEKTKGNLTDEEKKLLNDALHQVRMAFVQLAAGRVGPFGGR